MDAATTIFEERLRLADSINDYKRFFTQPHCKLLVGEALKATPEGSERLDYIVALARRCKTGLVSADQLAEQVNEAYSLRPMLQQKEGEEGEGERGGEDDVDNNEETNEDEEEDNEDEEKDDEEEDQEGHDEEEDQEEHDEDKGEEEDDEEEDEEEEEVDDEVKNLFATHKGFCSSRRWLAECMTFILPGEGYWLDAHRIKLFRNSTYEDFATATPKPTPVYIANNPWSSEVRKSFFGNQAENYHLCKKVAVSFDGNIYRATDGEIEAALAKTKGAPKVDAATYVKLARETRRRHAIERALKDGSCGNANEPKRRRVHVIM